MGSSQQADPATTFQICIWRSSEFPQLWGNLAPLGGWVGNSWVGNLEFPHRETLGRETPEFPRQHCLCPPTVKLPSDAAKTSQSCVWEDSNEVGPAATKNGHEVIKSAK